MKSEYESDLWSRLSSTLKIPASLLILCFYVVLQPGMADAADQRSIDKIRKQIDDIDYKISQLIQEKNQVIGELRQGLFCSKCKRTSTQLSKAGEEFFSHVGRVKGRVESASESVIAAKAREFDQKIAALENTKARLQDRLEQTVDDARRRDQQTREEERQRGIERKQEENRQIVDGALDIYDNQQRTLNQLNRGFSELIQGLQQKQDDLKQEQVDRERQWEREDQEEERMYEQQEQQRQDNLRALVEQEANFANQRGPIESEPSYEQNQGVNESEPDFDKWHRESVQRFERNQEGYLDRTPSSEFQPERVNPQFDSLSSLFQPHETSNSSDSLFSNIRDDATDLFDSLAEDVQTGASNLYDTLFDQAKSDDDVELDKVILEAKRRQRGDEWVDPKADEPIGIVDTVRENYRDYVQPVIDNLFDQIISDDDIDPKKATIDAIESKTKAQLIEKAKNARLFNGKTYYELPREERMKAETQKHLNDFADKAMRSRNLNDAKGAAEAHDEFQRSVLDDLLEPLKDEN